MPAVQLSDGTNVAESPSSTSSPDASPNIPYAVPQEEVKAENNMENNKDESTEEKEKESEWVDVLGSGQLKMKVTKKGEPDTRPQPSDMCEINLKGTLDDGTVVEDYEALQIQLGCHEVVQGIELAIPLMDMGEEAIVVVAARFAYGSLGNSPDIPPNATITYQVSLINHEPEPDLENVPFEKRRTLANNRRERGNWWYSRQDPTKAIQCYSKALDLLDETVPFTNEEGKHTEYTDEEMRDAIEQKLTIYNNLAAAQLMIEAYESALMSVNRVIQCDPKNIKALFRKGKILTAKGNINEAVEVLRQAFLLQPDNSAIKMELSRCVKVQQTEKQHEKNLYKKMLGQSKKDDKSTEMSKRKTNSWTKVLGTAATATIMAAIAFAVGYRFKNYTFL